MRSFFILIIGIIAVSMMSKTVTWFQENHDMMQQFVSVEEPIMFAKLPVGKYEILKVSSLVTDTIPDEYGKVLYVYVVRNLKTDTITHVYFHRYPDEQNMVGGIMNVPTPGEFDILIPLGRLN